MKKLVLATLATVTLLSATTSAYAANFPGACTREYDPTPYITKEGKLVYAPNQCIADLWAAQGK
ncbi:hypothetical protein NYR70_05535 [Actinobacillus equuli subsp. equuli]|uniref:Uncharacterized protein n=1 Tax=Actinobacillus equuli TaxID=718 RepID=A0AAX3FK65_ACTEU|nr:hypothetical protein [Actinobacillus equuli]AIZ79354.1 hypothetical protein ACEE_06110 [Actinobacillus equuli subsp. equuli]MDG4952596.1 hypothetical protein [Actinobacillus equuli subsp. equuli]WGE43472.1 hypothetical protein NYR65_06000 [Actinobacillus equuli subsp. equuli]WGE47727.1 hypothetical protein NYR67_05390 [Actinobacillus equuli subsp. equuli]WGE54120.1 hypothetical protein NYR70_05535 [Actinobacillus equuli subsp. equuli]